MSIAKRLYTAYQQAKSKGYVSKELLNQIEVWKGIHEISNKKETNQNPETIDGLL